MFVCVDCGKVYSEKDKGQWVIDAISHAQLWVCTPCIDGETPTEEILAYQAQQAV